jgi:hypothetical protein
VLSWRISNTMKAMFCVDCMQDAMHEHANPEVFDSDQGMQFTSEAFTGVLKREGITISTDERLTISLSSACGAASSMKTCTLTAIVRWEN